MFNRPSLCTEVWNPTCSHREAHIWHSQDKERHIWVTWWQWASILPPKCTKTLQRSGWDLLSWYPSWSVTPGDHPQMSGYSNRRASCGAGRLWGAQARRGSLSRAGCAHSRTESTLSAAGLSQVQMKATATDLGQTGICRLLSSVFSCLCWQYLGLWF